MRGIETSVPARPELPESEPAAPLSLDWFDEETSAPEPPAPGPDASSELLGGADLPAWLRRETEAPGEPAPVDARSLEWLTKLGPYDDDTAVAATADVAPRLSLPQPPMPSAAHLEALALLQRLAADPLPQQEAREEQAAPAWFTRIGGERLLYLLLLAALLAAMLVPGLTSSFQTPQILPEADALHEQIAALGPNDIVLLGYEWDAQRIGELRPLEQAVLSQLIEQRVKFVLVSTDPQGTLLQFDERDRLRAANYQEGGADYILLGYRPGNEFALRQLATNLFGTLQSDFQGLDATNGTLVTDTATSQPRLTHLNDFAMTIVMADEPNDVQAWMEQVRPSFDKPLVFLVPASVQPLAQPYFRQQNVFHLAGTNGALAYEQTRGGLTPATARQLGLLRLSTLIICGLLLIGIVIVLIRRMRSGEPQS
ncbi:MAG TPA: hypothetical protein VFT99_10465 [Roseiflexaceae bacterium]|nr:hypothetical protein [Roseiflexaceae bacterium]